MKGKLNVWFQNLSLAKKIILMVFACGVLPVIVISCVTIIYISRISRTNVMYSLNQGYEQVYQTINNEMEGMDSLSLQLSVNATLNKVFSLDADELNIADQMKYFQNINEYTDSMMTGANASRIYYYIDDRFVVTSSSGLRYRPFSELNKQEWYQNFCENGSYPMWISFDDVSSHRGKNSQYFGIIRSVWNESDYTNLVGIIGVFSDISKLSESLNPTMEKQYLWIEGKDGSIIASNEENFAYHQQIPVGEYSGRDSFEVMSYGEEKYYIRTSLIGDSNFYLVSLIAEDHMNIWQQSLKDIIWTFLLTTVWVILGSIIFSRVITYRLKKLKKHMQSVTKKEGESRSLDYFNEAEYRDEIGEVIHSYNYMVTEINKLLEKEYELGKEKTGAELKALQSQINPHFLYNTLDMINWMSKKGENEGVIEVVQSMAKYYRLVLNKGADIIKIREEITMCRAYMDIQNRRFRGKIQFEVDVQSDIEEYLIPKITLQPFIENAILHGIREKDGGRGVVVINGWLEENEIILSVTDDGNGMDEEQVEKLKLGGGHYGMENVKRRLCLFFKQEIPIQIESSPGLGTCIYIKLPMRMEEA